MNFKYTSTFIVLLFVCVIVSAQKEAAIWYFGEHAGLDFNTGFPVAITDGQLSTLEGCATISDNNGALLFYTDGITIWDKNHNIMPNGDNLLGSPSSSQSGIIVPNPGNANQYYVFTVGENFYNGGLHYSIVDISLNGGNGDVISSHKNLLLLSKSAEKIAAVEDDSDGFWVLSYAGVTGDEFIFNTFHAYRITSTGIEPSIKSTFSGCETGDGRGYLKISADAKKIIICNQNQWHVCLLDFNSATGVLDNEIQLVTDETPYGAEFSPSSEKVYVSTGNYSSSYNNLYQFDLLSSNIPGSRVEIYSGYSERGALQLAIDGKIYFARPYESYLGVINQPESNGVSCNYINNGVNLNGRISKQGLPPFIQSFLLVTIKTENTCYGDTTSFSINSNEPINSILWDFGDGTTSTNENPTHNYLLSGTYTVNVNIISDKGARDFSKQVIISTKPVASPVSDYYLCDDASNDKVEVFDLSVKNVEILGMLSASDYDVAYFNTNQNAIDHLNRLNTNYTNTVNGEEIFAKIYNIQNMECYDIARFKLYVDFLPISNTVEDIIICDDITNDETELINIRQFDTEVLGGQSASDFNITYHLSQINADNGILALSDNFQTITNPQYLYARIENRSNSDCYDTSSFSIRIDDYINVNQVDNISLCDDTSNDGIESFDLTQRDSQIAQGIVIPYNITYHESLDDAIINSNKIIDNYDNTLNPQEIFYRLENAENTSCYITGSFFIEVLEKPEILMSDTWYVCSNDFVTLSADSGYDSYLWSTGEMTQEITVSQIGFYDVTLTKNYNTIPEIQCINTKTIEVKESDEAVLIEVVAIDWTVGENELTILVDGIGDYEYSIDGLIYQDNNIFTNLKVGEYTIYIKDKNGCGVVNKTMFLLFYPQYFTPNGDGYHDKWQLYFANSEPDITITIFDKFGKLLKKLSPNSTGWDGTYNGKLLPNSDYWFVVNRPSKNEKYTGHFALKR